MCQISVTVIKKHPSDSTASLLKALERDLFTLQLSLTPSEPLLILALITPSDWEKCRELQVDLNTSSWKKMGHAKDIETPEHNMLH